MTDEEATDGPASEVLATSDLWKSDATAVEYREEVRRHAGMVFKVTRRSLTFPEEMRLAAVVVDPKTKIPNTIELLAHTVRIAVKDSSFGLTPDLVRKELPTRTALAHFLVNWLCGETMQNWAGSSLEDLRKKPGP